MRRLTEVRGFDTMKLAFIAALVCACGGGKVSLSTADGLKTSADGDGAEGATGEAAVASKCDTEGDQETSEYDTSGDGKPDVFKVFRRMGTETLYRLVLSCREVDLNGDGTKDIVRHYDDEGRPLREEADRNFDGKTDEITLYQQGEMMQQEFDSNADGKVDFKIFFENGEAIRSERDVSGGSTPEKWKADHWEYYENGLLVRMGSDLDGDGRVDRWDRDEALSRKPDEEAPSDGEEEAGESSEASSEGASGG